MGYTLAPEQLSAWHLQLPVLRAALAESVPGTNSAHNPACGIVIDDNTGGEFLTVDARLITEGDRERVGVSEVLEFYDAISASSIGLFMFSRP
jgi:hypothetical protein